MTSTTTLPCEVVEYIKIDGASGGYSICEPGKGISGSVADGFDCPAEAAEWAARNGYTIQD